MANQGQGTHPPPTAKIRDSVFNEASIRTRRVDTVQHAEVVHAGVVNIQHYNAPPAVQQQNPVVENPEPNNQVIAEQGSASCSMAGDAAKIDLTVINKDISVLSNTGAAAFLMSGQDSSTRLNIIGSAISIYYQGGALQQLVQQNPEAQVVQQENPEAQNQATASQEEGFQQAVEPQQYPNPPNQPSAVQQNPVLENPEPSNQAIAGQGLHPKQSKFHYRRRAKRSQESNQGSSSGTKHRRTSGGTFQQPVQQNPEAQVVQHENPEAQDQATASQGPNGSRIEEKSDTESIADDLCALDMNAGDGWKKLRGKVFIYNKTPLKKGYHIYKGEIRNKVPGIQPIPIAVKLLHPQGDADKTYLREVNKLIELEKHSNVTLYRESGYVMGSQLPSVFIALELCHEQNLHEYILEGGKTSGEIIFHHICVGLQYIHQKGIAHRDLKPSNVLLSRDKKHVLISDFGISKDVKKDISTIIPSNGYCGTYGWSAAEIISRGKQEINYFCADIFSLGLVGYFIMTHGKHPFSDPDFPTDAAMQHRNITKKENPNMAFIEEMPDGYIAKDLLEQLLNHNPLQRSSLEQIFRHPVFWDSNKKLNFIHTAHCYLRQPKKNTNKRSKDQLKKLEVDGTNGQKSLYTELENFFECESDASDSVQFVPDTPQDSAEDDEQEEQREPEDESFDEVQKCIDAVTNNWLSFLEGTLIKDSCMKETKDEAAYNTSTAELIRYMRNRREYYLQQKEEFKKKYSRNAGMWTLWSTHFPKFFPLLYQIVLPALIGDDRNTYIDEKAKYKTLDETS